MICSALLSSPKEGSDPAGMCLSPLSGKLLRSLRRCLSCYLVGSEVYSGIFTALFAFPFSTVSKIEWVARRFRLGEASSRRGVDALQIVLAAFLNFVLLLTLKLLPFSSSLTTVIRSFHSSTFARWCCSLTRPSDHLDSRTKDRQTTCRVSDCCS